VHKLADDVQSVIQCLERGWTLMDGVQALLGPMQPGTAYAVANRFSEKLVKLVTSDVRF